MLGVRIGQLCKSADILLLNQTEIIPTTTKKSTRNQPNEEACAESTLLDMHGSWPQQAPAVQIRARVNLRSSRLRIGGNAHRKCACAYPNPGANQ